MAIVGGGGSYVPLLLVDEFPHCITLVYHPDDCIRIQTTQGRPDIVNQLYFIISLTYGRPLAPDWAALYHFQNTSFFKFSIFDRFFMLAFVSICLLYPPFDFDFFSVVVPAVGSLK